MATDRPRIYLDSAPIIDLVKFKVGVGINQQREKDVWHMQQLLVASRDEKINLFTSAISILECVHVQDQNKLDAAKPFFLGLLASGKSGIKLVQPTLSLMERARDLRWIHGISLKGVDALHAATAIQFHCAELLTRDGRFAANKELLATLGVHVCTPSDTELLSDEYRQGGFNV